MRTKAECCFHGVGQGLFYSGIIQDITLPATNDKDKQFSFVYDCGTDSSVKYLNNEIDDFKKKLPHSELDLLVLSHLHEDHINGLPRLLQNIKVDTIVLPYYSWVERLALMSVSSKKGFTVMAEFYENPIRFLSRYEINTILLCVDESHNFENIIEEFPDMEDYDGDQQHSLNISIENVRRKYKTRTTKIFMSYKPEIKSKKLSWEFVFHKNIISRTFISDINSELIKLKVSNLSGLINNKITLAAVKKAYEDVCKRHKVTMNRTSLLMYHGSVLTKKTRLLPYPHFLHYCPYKNSFQEHCFVSKTGTLLTGDAELTQEDNLGDIEKISYNIGFLQVPHHGAKTNWQNYNWNKYFIYDNVISSGTKSLHHPHKDVLINLNNNRRNIEIVNELKSFTYSIVAHD